MEINAVQLMNERPKGYQPPDILSEYFAAHAEGKDPLLARTAGGGATVTSIDSYGGAKSRNSSGNQSILTPQSGKLDFNLLLTMAAGVCTYDPSQIITNVPSDEEEEEEGGGGPIQPLEGFAIITEVGTLQQCNDVCHDNDNNNDIDNAIDYDTDNDIVNVNKPNQHAIDTIRVKTVHGQVGSIQNDGRVGSSIAITAQQTNTINNTTNRLYPMQPPVSLPQHHQQQLFLQNQPQPPNKQQQQKMQSNTTGNVLSTFMHNYNPMNTNHSTTNVNNYGIVDMDRKSNSETGDRDVSNHIKNINNSNNNSNYNSNNSNNYYVGLPTLPPLPPMHAPMFGRLPPPPSADAPVPTPASANTSVSASANASMVDPLKAQDSARSSSSAPLLSSTSVSFLTPSSTIALSSSGAQRLSDTYYSQHMQNMQKAAKNKNDQKAKESKQRQLVSLDAYNMECKSNLQAYAHVNCTAHIFLIN